MKRVRVYRNLNRGELSIQHKTDQGWRVRDYSRGVLLKKCKFKVSKAGRARVLRERRKNVHAYVEGDLVSKNIDEMDHSKYLTPHYDPYKQDKFTINGVPVDEAPLVKITTYTA